MGVTVENAQVKIVGSKLTESGPLLITHWGMSGPAVLKLSAWGARELASANYHFKILVNWIPEFNENSLREQFQKLRFNLATQKIVNRNPFALPNRLWEYLLIQSGINIELRWADLPAKEQNKLITVQNQKITTLEAQIRELMETFQTLRELEELKLKDNGSKRPDDLFLASTAIDNFR